MVTGVRPLFFENHRENVINNIFEKFHEILYLKTGLQEGELSKDLSAFGFFPHELETSAEVNFVFVDEQQLVIIFLGLTMPEIDVIANSSFDNLKDLVTANRWIKREAHFDMTKNI